MDKINFRHIDSPEIRKAEDGSRKLTFVASDSSRDSAGTVLNQDGWDLRRFNSNGIIGYQHKVYGGWDDTENPDNIIGKGHAYIEEKDGKKRLMVDIEFEPAEINPLAEKIYQKLLFGSLKAVSVGFLPIGKGAFGKGDEAIGEKNETYYYAGQELLEVSVVNIPANPNALKKGLEMAQEELAALRAEAQPEPAPADPEPQPEPEDKSAQLALEKATIIARAALLNV